MEKVFFTDNPFKEIEQKRRYFVITDENVALYYDIDLVRSDVYVLPEGEKSKTMEYVTDILNKMKKARIRKSDYVLGFGGGVVTDIANFVASIYQRGIRCVSIPTTLIGMIDASFGGKNGVNIGRVKNSVGTFYSSLEVFINTNYLDTLPDEEFNNGLYEMVKYYFLTGDNKILDNNVSLEDKIRLCIEYKQDICLLDFKDKDERKKLNFGHTIGHLIELKRNIKHGYAVGIGMIYASFISYKLGFLSKEKYKDICNLIFLIDELSFDKLEDKEFYNLRVDKKVYAKHINFILLEDIGKPIIHNMPILEVVEICREFTLP